MIKRREAAKAAGAFSTARTAAELVRVNKSPAAYYYHRLRAIIYQAITDAKATTLRPILKQRIVPDAIVYSDSLPSYNALAVAGFRQRRINHSKRFAAGKNHLNGMENFWKQTKRTGVNLTVFLKSISPYS